MPDPLTALALLKRFWPALPIAALLAVVGWQHLQLGWKDDAIETAQQATREERDRRLVAEANFSAADGAVTKLNSDVAVREAELKAARSEAAALRNRADADFKATAATIASLRAKARGLSTDPCAVSSEATEALKDL